MGSLVKGVKGIFGGGPKSPRQSLLEGSEGAQYQDYNFLPGLYDQYDAANQFNQNLVNQKLSNQTRGMNNQLISQLQQQASGQAPSLAESLLNRNAAMNNQNAAAQIANASRMNPALAARLVMQNNNANNFGAAQNAATARIQEQQGAQQTLGNILNAQRQQDLAQAGMGANVGLNQQNINAGLFGTLMGGMNSRNAALMDQLAGVQGRRSDLYNKANAAQTAFEGQLLTAGAQTAAGAMGMAAEGGMVPGYAPGGSVDSYKNDVVPAMLSPKEIILPRSITMAKNAPEKAKKFVEKILKEEKPIKMAKGGSVKDRIAALEAEIACIPKMQGRRMADGGMVQPPKKYIEDPADPTGAIARSMEDPMMGGLPDPAEVIAKQRDMARATIQSPEATIDQKYEAAKKLQKEEEEAATIADVKAEEEAQRSQEMADKLDLIKRYGGGDQTENVSRETMSTPDGTPIVPASNQSAAAPTAGMTPTPTDSPLGKYTQAANEKYAAESKLAKLNMDTQNKLIADLEARHAAFKLEQDKLQKDTDELFNQTVNQKIDPKRFWQDKSTGQKIGSVIAIALSGIGNALSASAGITASNGALDMINRAIDRDIQAQKENQANTRSLYNMNLQRLGDARAAETATQSQMLTMATAQLSRNAAIVGTDIAKATRDAFMADAMIKIQDLNNQTLKATNEAKKAGYELAVPGIGLALDAQAAKEAREMAGKTKAFLSILDDIVETGKKTGRTLSPEARGQMESKIADLKSAYKEANKLGTLDKGVEELFDQLISNPTNIFQLSAQSKFKSLRDNTVRSATEKINPYMQTPVEPSFFSSAKDQEAAKAAAWAQANPNDPRAKEIMKRLGGASGR